MEVIQTQRTSCWATSKRKKNYDFVCKTTNGKDQFLTKTPIELKDNSNILTIVDDIKDKLN